MRKTARKFPQTKPGMKFGRLTVIGYAGQNKWNEALWWCKCRCGTTGRYINSKLHRKDTTSCGCRRAEVAVKVLAMNAEKGRWPIEKLRKRKTILRRMALCGIMIVSTVIAKPPPFDTPVATLQPEPTQWLMATVSWNNENTPSLEWTFVRSVLYMGTNTKYLSARIPLGLDYNQKVLINHPVTYFAVSFLYTYHPQVGPPSDQEFRSETIEYIIANAQKPTPTPTPTASKLRDDTKTKSSSPSSKPRISP